MMKKCPYCAEDIQDEAIKCKHCRSNLNKVDIEKIVTDITSKLRKEIANRVPGIKISLLEFWKEITQRVPGVVSLLWNKLNDLFKSKGIKKIIFWGTLLISILVGIVTWQSQKGDFTNLGAKGTELHLTQYYFWKEFGKKAYDAYIVSNWKYDRQWENPYHCADIENLDKWYYYEYKHDLEVFLNYIIKRFGYQSCYAITKRVPGYSSLLNKAALFMGLSAMLTTWLLYVGIRWLVYVLLYKFDVKVLLKTTLITATLFGGLVAVLCLIAELSYTRPTSYYINVRIPIDWSWIIAWGVGMWFSVVGAYVILCLIMKPLIVRLIPKLHKKNIHMTI